MANENVPPRIVEQRIRNRIIQYLEMISTYENDPPPFDLNEVLNQWNDWVNDECSVAEEEFPIPTYSLPERSALIVVNMAFNVLCKATPGIIEHEQKVLESHEWHDFVDASRHAMATLLIRGFFSESE